MLEKVIEDDLFGRSIKGYNWMLTDTEPMVISRLCQKFGISEVLAKIMANRGVSEIADAQNFLEPKIKNLMPDPFELKDMDKAASRLANVVINNEKITVFGDYDVDGATSSALLKRFFRDLGIDVGVYIPNRMLEGYGPSAEAFKKLKDEGNSLVVTVDCGSMSFEPIKAANEYGLEVIVLDHHLGGEELPEAYAVVNPNRLDEDFKYKSIAAVGVAFFTAVAIRAKLRAMKWFDYNPEPDLMDYLDLVALGTVCDVMVLSDINRAFVAQGLKMIAKRKNVGMAKLANVAKIDSRPESYHLGYVLGPRINAGGRVGEGLLGTELLSTEDPEKANDIALKLDDLNEERKAVEALILEEAMQKIVDQDLAEKPIIVVYGNDWHQGILGILASRIKEKYKKPAIVISLKDGMGKGSARSIAGINLGTLFSNAKLKGLLVEGGGHAMAGGLTIEEAKVEDFISYLDNEIKGTHESFDKAKELSIDSVLTVRGICLDLVKEILKAAPFGNGNPQPKFVLSEVIITMSKIVGTMHVMVIVRDKNDEAKKTLKCILFRGTDTELGDFFLNGVGKSVNIAGTIQINNWDHTKIDFIIEDAAVMR